MKSDDKSLRWPNRELGCPRASTQEPALRAWPEDGWIGEPFAESVGAPPVIAGSVLQSPHLSSPAQARYFKQHKLPARHAPVTL